jgi:hypothetical protein
MTMLHPDCRRIAIVVVVMITIMVAVVITIIPSLAAA